MRTLITGATGYIGWEVANQLAQAGARPRCLVRRPKRAALLAWLDVECVAGDLTSPASLTAACAGVDAVVHLGARALFERYPIIKPSIVDGSLALMEAAIMTGVKRFVFAASLLQYGNPPGQVDESTPMIPVTDYGRAKLEAETKLIERARQAGMSFCSIRLPHVYGARSILFEKIRRGLVVIPGPGKNVFSHLHIEDAAGLLVAAINSTYTGAAPVGDDLPCDWNRFLKLAQKLGPGFTFLRIPTPLAKAGAAIVELLAGLLHRPAFATRDAVTGFNQSIVVKTGLLQNELNYTLKHPTHESGLAAVMNESTPFRWRHCVDDNCR